jgi:hypothetical protein
MKRFAFLLLVAAATASCGDKEPREPGERLVMASEADTITLSVKGGDLAVDWGDGSRVTVDTAVDITTHRYARAGTRTITVTGTGITRLTCTGNRLTSLDVSHGPALSQLSCDDNQLSAAALDALFSSLRSSPPVNSTLRFDGNPGSDACDVTIAKAKGWLSGRWDPE